MAIREGRWDCTTCGNLGILGRRKDCPGCGSPRSEETRFYLPDNAEAVKDPAVLELAKSGPDWLCEFCSSSSAAADPDCDQCGAPKGSSPSKEVKEYDLASVPRSSEEETPPPQAETPVYAGEPPKPKGKSGRAALFGCGGLGCLGIGAAAVLAILGFFSQKDLEASVAELSWDRTIAVERLETTRETGWEIPSGARKISEERALHHQARIVDHYESKEREVTEKVKTGTRTYVCGQKDLGNGYFEDVECTEPVYENRTRTESYRDPVYRKEPVYQTRYTYELDSWRPARTERRSGRDQSPMWPVVKLAKGEREGARGESFQVTFRDGAGTSYLYEPDGSGFQALDPANPYVITVNRITSKVTSVRGP